MGWLEMIGQIAGSAAGDAASKMQTDEVMRLIRGVSDQYGKINVPELQRLLLEKQKGTELNNVKEDPNYRAQQNAADAQLNDVIQSGGLTLADRAALNSVRNKISRTESAGRNAIKNDMASRGALDSGAQLAMQLQGNQQAANSGADLDAQTTGRMDARHFEAIRERARNAGQGLDRSYQQQSDRARAQDAINAGNTAIANTANRYNAGIPQQDFENKLKKTAASSGADYALAGANAAQAKDIQQRATNMGKAGGQGAQSAYNSFSSRDTSGGNSAPPNPSLEPESEDQWNAYPSNGLSGESTRPGRQVIGHRVDGSPIYGDELK